MKMIKLLALTAALVIGALLYPTPVQASGNCGWMCQIFGWDAKTVERTEIKEQAATERAQIEADAELERQRIENQRYAEQTHLQNEQAARLEEINRAADQRLAEAAAEVERVKLQQFATQAQRDAEIARVKAAADQYTASINAMRDQQIAIVNGETQKSLAALQGATQIGLESLVQAGETKRWALTTDTIWSVMLIVGLVFLGWYFLKKQSQPQIIQVLPGPGYNPHQLPNGYRAQLPGYRAQIARRSNPVEQEISYYDDTSRH